ncbi:MAG: outer membrane beta-barrel protein [Bacteroidota bacterium]|nr:outer membrane beta-barrel protein [Bacteroidota bacterium]
MRRILLAILTGCCLFFQSYSQGILKGKLIDSASKQPLGLATIAVFKAADTVLLTYRLSTPEGDFKVPGLPFDINCRVVISFSGYSIFRKEFKVTNDQATVDIGTLSMSTDSKSLDEVLVMAERPPVIMKKDTIEFNASAFKTLPNALVEDLLKKLPGVQVDGDGNITVNGKPVNRILVDGKTFFGDDPRMATRNLPANVIDKVQVMDDKEELMRNGDDNLNNVGKVVNITLKKGVKKGWFGKLYAGAGSDARHEAGGIANIFRDTLQVSVLGYLNNLNKPGFTFTDLQQTGGFSRNRSNTLSNSTSVWNTGNGSGITINGVNFGGVQGSGGIATSKGAGFNINHVPNLKKSIFAQYFYGNVLVDRQTGTTTDQFNADTVINNNTQLRGTVLTNAHNMGIGARLKPDSLINIVINTSLTIGNTNDDRVSDIAGTNNKLGDLSEGNVSQFNNDKLYYYRHAFSFTKLSGKKAGRRFTISHNLDMNNKHGYYTTESDIQFLYPSAYDSIYGQLRKEHIPRTDATMNFNYSEPIAKRITIRLGGRYEYSGLKNNINTFNKNVSQKYELFNPVLSSNFERVSNRVIITPGIEFKWKNFTVTPSVRGLFQRVDNSLASLPASIVQKQNDLLPALSAVYKQISFNYNRDIVLPGYNYLIPVTDNTNPYFIANGNPNLVPSRRDNFSVNYYYNDTKRSINAGGYINAGFIQHDVVQSTTVDDKGIQTMLPVNANGSKNYSMNWNVNKQYKNKQKFIFSWYTGNYLNYNINKLIFNHVTTQQTNVYYNHWFGINLNWNDKLEWNNGYNIGLNYTRYTSAVFKEQNIVSHNLNTELIVRWPRHLIWETQLAYGYNSSIPAGSPKNLIRWNAALNITMLKDERGVLRISAFDLLKQNNSINVSASRNMVTTTQTNVLPQYFLATFTYNMRAVGASKKVGGSRLLMF